VRKEVERFVFHKAAQGEDLEVAKDLVEGSDRPVRDREYDSRYQTQVAKSVETLKATEEPEKDVRLVGVKTSRRKRRIDASP
jgi:non-homologous end joining protein Ku